MLLLVGGVLALIFLPLPWAFGVIAVLAAKEVAEISVWLWLRRRPPASGHEALVGAHGVLSGRDRVRIRGSSYPARVLEGAPGDEVVVESVDGMTLVVRRDGRD